MFSLNRKKNCIFSENQKSKIFLGQYTRTPRQLICMLPRLHFHIEMRKPSNLVHTVGFTIGSNFEFWAFLLIFFLQIFQNCCLVKPVIVTVIIGHTI